MQRKSAYLCIAALAAAGFAVAIYIYLAKPTETPANPTPNMSDSQWILRLGSDRSDEEVKEAIGALESLGKEAFPSLIANLDNPAPAANCLGDRISVSPGQNTVGAACYRILVTQIEGYWNKEVPYLYFLNRDNIKSWLADNHDATLEELRVLAAEGSLARLERDGIKDPSYIAFAKARLDEVRAELRAGATRR